MCGHWAEAGITPSRPNLDAIRPKAGQQPGRSSLQRNDQCVSLLGMGVPDDDDEVSNDRGSGPIWNGSRLTRRAQGECSRRGGWAVPTKAEQSIPPLPYPASHAPSLLSQDEQMISRERRRRQKGADSEYQAVFWVPGSLGGSAQGEESYVPLRPLHGAPSPRPSSSCPTRSHVYSRVAGGRRISP